MKTLVMKFGGTSVGSVEALNYMAAIVQEQASQWDGLVVVVSAMSGVTDLLVRAARTAADGDEHTYRDIITELSARHRQTIDALITADDEKAKLQTVVYEYLEELSAFCNSIHVLAEVTPRGMDAITSLGERINARVVAAFLWQQGLKSQAVDATDLIVTDENFQNAMPLMDLTCERVSENLAPLLEDGIVPVVTGFVSASEKGVITTLGRGGSDYTASILGVCLCAAEVWTWTDVDGVMTADPRAVPEARVVPELSFAEISELAYFGAKVLHPKTIRPIIEEDIPLWVKNTFNASYPGTRICAHPEAVSGRITAITAIKNLSMVTVEGRGMLGVPGIAARTFAAVARVGASVLMISQSSSEQSICFLIPTDTAPAVIASLESEMALELARRDIDRIWAHDDVVIVTVIGSGLRDTPGVGARVFGALGEANINVIAIAQGSSEFCISLVVKSEEGEEAVRHIHKRVIEEASV
ncbi:MAG: aspartate kinase [Anaerolineales bacterium]|nr:aspartate kinase [Anaerolineales bacterium]